MGVRGGLAVGVLGLRERVVYENVWNHTFSAGPVEEKTNANRGGSGGDLQRGERLGRRAGVEEDLRRGRASG